jgi:hypothetical protein
MIKSIASLVIQIALVITAVVIFSYFDPFGLLSPKKKTLQDTPITVVSIREIGQLITAEYYGEVLSTLQDSLIAEISFGNNGAANEFAALNKNYLQALKDFYLRKDSIPVRWYKRRADLINHFYAANHSLTNAVFYQDMINLIVKKGKYGDEGDLLLDVWKLKTASELPLDFQIKCAIDTSAFNAKKKIELNELKKTKAFKKRQIIALGRGWVKAGIDFGSFTDKNFKYDREKKIIYLLGVVPTILACDINPWFIPERKVKGFEIIAATNKANNPESLLKVKGSCLTKLRAQAEAGGIIKQAKINAEQSLKDFFSLLLIEPIAEVKIMENPFEMYAAMFPKDKIVPAERLSTIDSVLLSLKKIDSDSAYKMAERLSAMKWNSGSTLLPVNRYSHLAYRMSEDDLLSSDEWKQLTAQFKDSAFSRLDSLWFFPYKRFPSMAKANRAKWKKQKYPYEATFWMDSVLQRPAYDTFKILHDSTLRLAVLKVMEEQRKSSQSDAVLFLKKSIKTIRLDKQVVLNVEADIRTRLDSLNN